MWEPSKRCSQHHLVTRWMWGAEGQAEVEDSSDRWHAVSTELRARHSAEHLALVISFHFQRCFLYKLVVSKIQQRKLAQKG